MSSVVVTDSCPNLSDISSTSNPISISILAWLCLKKSKRLDFFCHSHASLLISKLGAQPNLVADRLGHEKIQTTLSTYSHLYPEQSRQLAEKLNMLVENENEE